jgi:hypothetical protein
MSKLAIRPTAGYRPHISQDEADAIEASIPDGYRVSVLVNRRTGLGLAVRLCREDSPEVIAVSLSSERSLAADVAWLVETYATEERAA